MICRHRILSFFVCSFFVTPSFFLSSASTSQALKRALAIRRHATHSVLREYGFKSQATSHPTFGNFGEHYHVHHHQKTNTHEELKFNQKFNWNTHYEQEIVSGLKQAVDYVQLQKQSVNYYNPTPTIRDNYSVISFYEDKIRFATITPQHQLEFRQKTVTDWQTTCSKAAQCPTLYSLYQFDSYREFVKNQSNYQAEMAKIHVTMSKDDSFVRWLKTVPNNAYDYIAKEAYKAFVETETEALRKINNDTHLTTKSSIDRIKNQLDEQEKNLTTVVANPATVDYVAETCRQELSTVQALKSALDTVSKQPANEPLEYCDYSKNLTSEQLYALNSFGITAHDFVVLGTASQHSMRSKLFVEQGLIKIADLMLANKTQGSSNAALRFALKNSVQEIRQGALCIRKNDISGMTKHVTAMADLVAYAQSIQQGQWNYKDIYSVSLLDSLHKQYFDYCEAAQKEDYHEFMSINRSICRLQCTKDCAQKEHHQNLRTNNTESRRCVNAKMALNNLMYSHDNIVVKQYELSKTMQELLHKAGIPTSIYQKCTGNEYELAMHEQMVDFLKKAALLHDIPEKQEAAQDLLNVSYAGLLATHLGEHQKVTLAMKLGHTLYRYAYNPKMYDKGKGAWVNANQEEICRRIVVDFKRIMTENTQSLSNSSINIAEDLRKLEKLSCVLANLTKADSPKTPINIEEQSKHVSQNTEKLQEFWKPFINTENAINSLQMLNDYRTEQIIDILLSNALGKITGHCLTLTKNYLTVGMQALQKSETFAKAVGKCTTALEKLEGVFVKNIPNIRIADTNIKAPASLMKQVGAKIGSSRKEISKSIKKIVLSREEIALKYANKVKEIIEQWGDKFREIQLPLPDADFIHHVLDRHFPGGDNLIDKNGLLRSIFNEGENFIEIVVNGWKYGQSINNRTKIYDVGRIIGKTGDGQLTSMVRVVVDHKGCLLTMFPV